MVGLAHISELLDGPVKDIVALFQPKQSVRAVVTKVDTEAGRLSLSLKPSALAAAEAAAEGEGAKGAKRKRAKDIDDEMVEAADEEEEEKEDRGRANAGQGRGSTDSCEWGQHVRGDRDGVTSCACSLCAAAFWGSALA